MLEGLGWNIHRVWSTDWFKYPSRESGKVQARVDALLAREKAAPVVLPALRDNSVPRPAEPVLPIRSLPKNVSAVAEDVSQHPSKLGSIQPASTSHSRPETIPPNNQLSLDAMRQQLIALRENVIRVAFANSDPARGLLRKALLDAFLRERPRDLRDWLLVIPKHLREETERAQVDRFLTDVLAILSRRDP